MLKGQFLRYGLIGVSNTASHWLVFYLVISLGYNQAIANTLGFIFAATASYFLNARFTFQAQAKTQGYAWFMLGMGSISYGVGALGDSMAWPGLVTLVIFSFISFTLGFAWSKWWVFQHKN